MIFSDFLKAIAQMSDPRFLRVVLFGIGLSLALLVGAYAGFLWLIDVFTPGTVDVPLIGPVSGLHTLLGAGSLLLMLGLSMVLMVPVASAFTGFFVEDVAQAVEDKHYPWLPPVPRVPLGDMLIDTANFLGVIIAVNLFGLLLYAFAGPFIPLVFWALNGMLLGREYFTVVATRRLGRAGANALRKQHRGTIWLAGILMAAPLSVPLVNLIIPVLGVATFTHLYHRLKQDGFSET